MQPRQWHVTQRERRGSRGPPGWPLPRDRDARHQARRPGEESTLMSVRAQRSEGRNLFVASCTESVVTVELAVERHPMIALQEQCTSCRSSPMSCRLPRKK